MVSVSNKAKDSTAEAAELKTGQGVMTWGKEFPQVEDGVYWIRYHEGGDADIGRLSCGLVQVAGGAFISDSRHRIEYLGPISPSDTEELLALREAATKAEQMLAAIEHDIQQHPVPRSEVLAISEWASDGSHYNHALLNIETLNDVSAQLRKALGKE